MRSRRVAVVAVLALALLPALVALDSRSFFSPDETNYSQVAREMLETGDLVVPYLDGHAWFNKPPLAYWLLAAAFTLLGWGFPAAVLLNTLLTALTAIVLLLHTGGSERPRAGVLAAVAYLTMALPLTIARTALTDPALVLCTTAAVALLVSRRRGGATAAGVALGLGVLAKGPVAPLVVLPAAAVAAWQAGRGGWRRPAIALATAVAVVLPWQLALLARGVWAAWAAEFVGHETVARATEAWHIGAPWWYYLPVAWAALFPWGTHLALAVAACLRGSSAPCRTRPQLPEIAAVVVPLAAFSIATNKLPHYLLPALPFLAVWLGRAADRLWEQDRVPAPRWTAALIALSGGGALGGIAWLAARSRIAGFLPPGTAAALIAAAAVFVALAAIEAGGRRRAAWAGMAVLALVLRLGLDAVLVPYLDRQNPERPLAESVRAHLAPGGQPIAHRWWRTGFVAYGVRGWRATASPKELAAALGEAWSAARQTIVVVRADSEGEGRAAVWRGGGEAVELARISGPGEIDGEVVEGVVFEARPVRSGTRWFYDADAPAAGELGMSGVETNRWVPSFRWSCAAPARLVVTAGGGGAATLRMRCWGISPSGSPQRLAVRLGDRPIGETPLTKQPSVVVWSVPAGLLDGRPLPLQLDVDPLEVPARHDASSRDERALGVALDWIALDPALPARGTLD
jgi:4-amino-4-deoxy-L-arabinose transferase-like glycosyltransferase